MKRYFVILLIGLFGGLTLQAEKGPDTDGTTMNEMVEAELVVAGTISLFTRESQILPATISEDPMESYTVAYTDYYISKGDDQLVEVCCGNYKKILRGFMGNNPELADKLGSKGYRFKDLEQIVNAYNQY